MKPYYEENGIIIYNADCREVLPSLPAVDLVLTDPPYGVSEQTGTVGRSRAGKHEYTAFADSLERVVAEVIPRVTQCLEISSRAIITPGPLAMCYYPQPESFGVFYQPATVGLQKWGRADAQPIFYYGRDPRVGVNIRPCSFVVTSHEKNGHPCPKPLGVWKSLLQRGSMEGEIVLDPFMGSGTTLRAAKDMGRKAIGIEICEEYCEIAAERLRQGVLQFA